MSIASLSKSHKRLLALTFGLVAAVFVAWWFSPASTIEQTMAKKYEQTARLMRDSIADVQRQDCGNLMIDTANRKSIRELEAALEQADREYRKTPSNWPAVLDMLEKASTHHEGLSQNAKRCNAWLKQKTEDLSVQ
jgi:hypothetical protein